MSLNLELNSKMNMREQDTQQSVDSDNTSGRVKVTQETR
jgi:hypothetical protein